MVKYRIIAEREISHIKRTTESKYKHFLYRRVRSGVITYMRVAVSSGVSTETIISCNWTSRVFREGPSADSRSCRISSRGFDILFLSMVSRSLKIFCMNDFEIILDEQCWGIRGSALVAFRTLLLLICLHLL